MVGEWTGSTALVVVDVQRGFDDATHWGPRNNPDCEANIALLIDAWRTHGWPLVYVKHLSLIHISEPTRPMKESRMPSSA